MARQERRKRQRTKADGNGVAGKNALRGGGISSDHEKVADRLRVLGSSSAGNAALLSAMGAHLLIDAGLSGRQTVSLLREEGLELEDLEGVCLTHEHGDHSRGLRGMAKCNELKAFANYETARAVQERLDRRMGWQLFQNHEVFRVGPFEVTAVTVPHDAYDPVCFFISWGDGDLFAPRRTVAWVNDLGHVPLALAQRLAKVDCLVIEANHDEAMLEADTRRPWSLKQRIRGRHGHLSNRMTLEALQEVDNPSWSHLVLTHLSRDCNDVALVRDTFAPLKDRLSGLAIQVVEPGCFDGEPACFGGSIGGVTP